MSSVYLPELGGVYLEDSYFLGLTAEGPHLRLKMLLALTTDHPAYRVPNPGEQHCYREGNILIEQPSIMEWKPGTPRIFTDPHGTFDLGSIELYRQGERQFRIATEWFETILETSGLSVQLAGEDCQKGEAP